MYKYQKTGQVSPCAFGMYLYVTCGSALLAVTEGGRPETPQPEVLGPLLPRRVTCLVGMPQLLAVVAELCSAAFTPTGDLWAAGTAERNDCVTGRGKIQPKNGGEY